MGRESNMAANKESQGSGPREKLVTPTGTYFARRDDKGRFTELDEIGRSLAADRRQHAKTKKPSGQGDKGD
jgi:hypothetical protein